MNPARKRPAPARPRVSDLVRLVIIYLCLVLVTQGCAAASALGAGPLHHHDGPATADPLAGLVFSHHGHQHRSDQRHHHAHDDSSVRGAAAAAEEGAFDLAAFALTAALALLAYGAPQPGTEPQARHVWRPAAACACCTGYAELLYEPPRRS